jgi:GLPGLI family protein
MRKIFNLSFLLLSIVIFSQTNRFFYDYKFISDSTDKSAVTSEVMLLDIDKNGSNYYSQQKFVVDSTAKADLEKQLKSSPNNISIHRKDKPGNGFL